MADEAPATDDAHVKFTVKTSKDAKYELDVSLSTTIAEVKEKLSTVDYASIPTDRIRLIYSGRVLKDPDTLSSIKIKDGHTVHLVQGAASNARQNPANQASSSNTTGQTTSATPAVPQFPTMATGTGNNPLAGITGARYAGFHGLPGMDMFGPDGGMGAPPNPDEMMRMMDNPMFLSQMTEAMNNPAVIQMMQESPMLRNNPIAREMLQNPDFRRMLLDPNVIRSQLQMQRAMGGQANNFPAPGATNTTPEGQPSTNTTSTLPNTNNNLPNPFAMPGNMGGAANPFSALFGNPTAQYGTTPATSPPPASSTGQVTPSLENPVNQQTNNAAEQNAFANLLRMMQGQQGGGDGLQGGAQANPFAGLFNNPMGMGMGMPQTQPVDNRPPEERYADQLRQLNDMGFYDFDRNVQALRRSGGSVQGAIDSLLNSS